MSFQNPLISPTTGQYALIGEAITVWGIIDHLTTRILARLAGCPDFTGLTLTEKLPFNASMEAIDNLVFIHRERYGCTRIPEDALLAASALVKRLRVEKQRRNRYAHDIWFRMSDDEVLPVRLRGKQHDDRKPDESQPRSLDDLQSDITEARTLIELQEALLSLLPEVQEMP